VNWLAHLWLGGDEALLRIGNLMGDFVRGIDLDGLHPELRRGVHMHRSVDGFTDAHPDFRRSRARLQPRWRHWSGLLVDVAYDHLLARDFEHWTGEPLDAFVDGVHADLDAHRELLSPSLRRAAPKIMAADLLRAYRTRAGVAGALRSLGRRARRDPGLEAAAATIHEHDAGLAEDFADFFPQLRDHAAHVRRADV